MAFNLEKELAIRDAQVAALNKKIDTLVSASSAPLKEALLAIDVQLATDILDIGIENEGELSPTALSVSQKSTLVIGAINANPSNLNSGLNAGVSTVVASAGVSTVVADAGGNIGAFSASINAGG